MKKRAKKTKKTKHAATASKARARAKSSPKHAAKGRRRKARGNPTAMLHNPASHVIVLAQERGRTMKKRTKSKPRRGKKNPHRHHKKLAGAAAVSHLAKRQEKRSGRRRRRGKKNPIDFKEFGGMLLKGGIGAEISAVLNLGLVTVLPLTMSATARTIAQVGATAAAAGAALMAKQPAIAAGIVGGGMGGVAELALAKVVTPAPTGTATQAKSVSGFGAVHRGEFGAVHDGFGAVHDGFGAVVDNGNPFWGPVG